MPAGLAARAHRISSCGRHRRRDVHAAIRVDALRALALAARRLGAHEEAASYWRQILEVRNCPSSIARQASEALAIHYEHRVRDLPAAKAFALNGRHDGSVADERVRHRIARIERKIQTRRLQPASLGLI
jgi:hypothetical protein